MPMIKSPRDSARTQNIREAMRSYAAKGTFHGRRLDKKDARKQILAAAYANQRRAKK